MLELRGVSFAYGNREVLHDIDLEIPTGAFMGLIGPNGSGKTTLLKLIMGLLKPTAGEVYWEGKVVRRIKRRHLARILAVVSQEYATAFPFCVKEIVLMGRSPHMGAWRFEGERDLAVVREAMEMTDTLHLAERPMDHLSGGEKQRVLIARALAQEPRVLLLDEPTAYLDIKHQVEFFELIHRLNRERGLTILAVTHDINLASLYCDFIVLLRDGRIYLKGTPEEVVREDHIQAVYVLPVLVDRHPVIGVPRVTPRRETPSASGSRWETGAAPQL